MPCKYFYITRDTVRVIVGRGVTDAGNPAEIAYSDDFGTTWHLVNLGATVAACLPWVGSIFALDYRHIWAGTNLGALWFSDDGGVTWTLMFTATMGTNRIYSIRFRDETYGLIAGGSAGAGGLLYSTVDGGVTWLPLTAPVAMVAASIYACELIDKNRFWLGFGLNDGDLYYSNDAGVTWVHRNIVIPSPITSLDRVSEINFIDEQCVFVGITGSVGAVNYGCLFRSFDGGFSWESWVSPAMGALVGICGIHACSYNKCYWVGQPIAGLLGTVAIVSG
jgi:photosystem II stability/assembly factor-like uncharacterized protein